MTDRASAKTTRALSERASPPDTLYPRDHFPFRTLFTLCLLLSLFTTPTLIIFMPDCVTRLGRVPSLIYFHMYTSIDKESTPQFIRPFDNKDKQSELLYLST